MKSLRTLLVCLGLVVAGRAALAITATPTPRTQIGGDSSALTRRNSSTGERILGTYPVDPDSGFTVTSTGTATSTPTGTPVTNTLTPTPTLTPIIVQTKTFTQTLTPNGSGTYTSTATNTPNTVITQSFTPTFTPNGSGTYTSTATNTPNTVITQTFTPTFTANGSGTYTPTLTLTPAQVTLGTPTTTPTACAGTYQVVSMTAAGVAGTWQVQALSAPAGDQCGNEVIVYNQGDGQLIYWIDASSALVPTYPGFALSVSQTSQPDFFAVGSYLHWRAGDNHTTGLLHNRY